MVGENMSKKEMEITKVVIPIKLFGSKQAIGELSQIKHLLTDINIELEKLRKKLR